MKCPKCSLVTFDHLSKCPRCKQTFDLARRLTRRRTNPHRRIVIRSATAAEETTPQSSDSGTAPDLAAPSADATPETPPTDLRASAPATPDRDTPPASSSPVASPPAPSVPEPQTARPAAPETTADSDAVPSLQAMAESELQEDVAVNVSAAVKAVRETVRRDATPEPTDAAQTATPPADEVDTSPASDSTSIKERMVRSSRARRKQRPDLVTEAIDPVLPDWYEPDLDDNDGVSGSEGKSASRG